MSVEISNSGSQILEQLTIEGRNGPLKLDLSSDWHLPLSTEVSKLVAQILREKRSDILFLLGDFFETDGGVNAIDKINELIQQLSTHYRNIVLVLGNHDLRHRQKPWEDLIVPENVICPVEDKPINIEINGIQFLIANIFYDDDFIPASVVGVDKKELEAFWKSTDDGKYLFGGDRSIFKRMRDNLIGALNLQTDVLVTHCPASRAVITLRTNKYNERMVKFAEENQMLIEWTRGRHGKQSPDYWNRKGLTGMGTQVLEHPDARFQDELIAMHGHTHRSGIFPYEINCKWVSFVSNQPNLRGINLNN